MEACSMQFNTTCASDVNLKLSETLFNNGIEIWNKKCCVCVLCVGTIQHAHCHSHTHVQRGNVRQIQTFLCPSYMQYWKPWHKTQENICKVKDNQLPYVPNFAPYVANFVPYVEANFALCINHKPDILLKLDMKIQLSTTHIDSRVEIYRLLLNVT